MARIGHEFTAQDSAGNIIPSADVEVRNRSDNSFATIYDAETGGSAITQPGFQTDSNGDYEFWVEPGRYNVTVGSGVSAKTYPINQSNVSPVYNTRQDFVDVVSDLDLLDGTIVFADGLQYKASSGATDISDLPGFVPAGDVYLTHFGENTTPGTTDMRSAWQDCASYCVASGLHMNLVEGEAVHVTHNGSPLAPSGSGQLRINGNGAAVTMGGADATYRPFMNNSHGSVRVYDITFTFPDVLNASGPFLQAYSNFKFYDCSFNGNVTDVGGGVAKRTSYVTQSFNNDLDDFGFIRCKFDKVTNRFLKTNSSTEASNGYVTIDCEMADTWLNGGINSPSGDCFDLKERGTIHRNTTPGPSLLAVSGASVQVANFSDISIRGPVNYALHFEEKSHDVTVTGVSAQIDGGFFRLLSNNIGGTREEPQRFSLSSFAAKHTGTAVDGEEGINLVYTTDVPAKKVSISDGVVEGFYRGIVVGSFVEDRVLMNNIHVQGCTFGALFGHGVPQGMKNITVSDCTTAVRIDSGGGILDGWTFRNNTSLLDLQSGPVIFKDCNFGYDDQNIPATSSVFLRMLQGIGKCDVNCYGTAFRENWSDSAAAARVQWDGATETITDLGTINDSPTSSEFLLIDEAASVAVNAGGTGYAVDDILTVSGGTLETAGAAATVRVTSVSSGVVTGVSVETGGEYSSTPANPASTTGGTGTGCTVDITYQKSVVYKVSSTAGVAADHACTVSTTGFASVNVIA